MARKPPATRSPLRDPAYRRPGQSIQAEIDSTFDNEVLDSTLLMFVPFTGLLFTVVQWLFPAPRGFMVAVMGVLLVASVVYALPRLLRARKKIRKLRLGQQGELTVAEHLDRLRENAFQVIHDVPADGFNIDHVIVGSQGVFAIETKTMSKPVDANVQLHYNGRSLKSDRGDVLGDPVGQAQGQARWLQRLIQDSSGKTVFVRPVLAYPGWFVNSPPRSANVEVWVIEPKALAKFIRYEPERLAPEEVRLITHHLKLHIKASDSM